MKQPDALLAPHLNLQSGSQPQGVVISRHSFSSARAGRRSRPEAFNPAAPWAVLPDAPPPMGSSPDQTSCAVTARTLTLLFCDQRTSIRNASSEEQDNVKTKKAAPHRETSQEAGSGAGPRSWAEPSRHPLMELLADVIPRHEAHQPMHVVLFLHCAPIEGGVFRYLDVWAAELFAGVVSLRGSRWQGCRRRLDPSGASVGANPRDRSERS